MVKNINFLQGQIVKFTKKAKVFDLDSKKEFPVPKGTTAKVVTDQDVGNVGSCQIRLKKIDGTVVFAETDDKFLKLVK